MKRTWFLVNPFISWATEFIHNKFIIHTKQSNFHWIKIVKKRVKERESEGMRDGYEREREN